MKKKKLRILCFGEAMVELSAIDFTKESSRIGFAGDTLNTAIYLKRFLGQRAEVDYLTVLGLDFFSEQLAKYIESEHVGTDIIRRISSRSIGMYAISTDLSGERKFAYWRDRSAARLLFDNDEDFVNLRDYDLIYFSGISLAILPEKVRDDLLSFFENEEQDLKIAFDSNYRPNLWESRSSAQKNIERAFKCCDIALPSLDDQIELTNSRTESAVVDWFYNNKVNQTVLKRGAKGPRLIGAVNKNCTFAPELNVVDSTAAGDSFNAGFLAAYFMGQSFVNSAWHGHELAKVVLTHQGAICPKASVPVFSK